jgi:hypothetical protein
MLNKNIPCPTPQIQIQFGHNTFIQIRFRVMVIILHQLMNQNEIDYGVNILYSKSYEFYNQLFTHIPTFWVLGPRGKDIMILPYAVHSGLHPEWTVFLN